MDFMRVVGVLLVSVWVAACSGSADVSDGSDIGGSGGSGTGGESPGTSTGGTQVIDDDPKPTCKPKTCEELGKNCGKVADGCGDILDCGGCGPGLHCGAFTANVCPTPQEYADLCQPRSKEEACAGKECGIEGDGCGNTYVCGTCEDGFSCGVEEAFKCGENPNYTDDDCPAKIQSCADVGVQCGMIGNGCGGTLDCSAEIGCDAGDVCGLESPGQCGTPATCVTKDPDEACAGTCGLVSDGCNGTIDCSAVPGRACPAGETCGGGGIRGQCGSGATACNPLDIEEACGDMVCGQASNGCGGSYACGPLNGACGANEVCRQGACEPVACIPMSQEDACDAAGAECGLVSDGCSGSYNCGTCTGFDQCGFLSPFQCDFNPNIVPGECQPLPNPCAGKQCGIAYDGCGTGPEHQVNCGSCDDGEFCGLEEAFQCSSPIPPDCTPDGTSCSALGWACGIAVDNCGNTYDCADENLVCGGLETCMGIPTVCQPPDDVGDCPLCDAIPACPENQPTTLSGRVIIPGQPGSPSSNHVGVPNAIVYILRTNDPADLPPIDEGLPSGTGARCDRCEDIELGDVLVSAVTDSTGHFQLVRNIPLGEEFLLVVRAGKFRRAVHYTLPADRDCEGISLPITMATNNPTRLPRDRNDGVGVHIPRIAVSTGAIDAMECVFYKMGLAESEFTRSNANGRVHVYRSNGAYMGGSSCAACDACGSNNQNCIKDNCNGCSGCSSNSNCNNCRNSTVNACKDDTSATNLYSNVDDYDMVVFDCEGGGYDSNGNRRGTYGAYVREYVNRGGRLFASHLSHTWLGSNGFASYNPNTPVATGLNAISTWESGTGTLHNTGTGQISFENYLSPYWPNANPSPTIDRFAEWMVNEGITSANSNYTFSLAEPRSMATGPGEHVEVFAHVTNLSGNRVQQFSVNTPYGAPEEAACGRIAYSGFHVSAAGSGTSPFSNSIFPGHCTGSLGNNGVLTDQEKILLYMLFDLGACVGDDPEPPQCEPAACPNDGTCGARPTGCGGTQECGCPEGQTCSAGLCTDITCAPLTDCGSVTCATLSDGCGGALVCDCPECEPNTQEEACENVSCGYASDGCSDVWHCGDCPPDCVPIDECPEELNCGVIGDGCNGTLDCGTCPEGSYCGANGTPNVCGTPQCEPLSCEDLGAQCGAIGDGCGGSDHCGDCPQGQVCTTVDGIPNQCTGCQPIACEPGQCGVIGDGCGGTVECDPCPNGLICGAQAPNECGTGTSCTPRTCDSIDAECGIIGDGCGDAIDCGACPVGKVCGIDTPFKCGDPPACTPKTCEELNAECGAIGDGCGGLLECGDCVGCGQQSPNRCPQVIR